jgi:hypothetical protein
MLAKRRSSAESSRVDDVLPSVTAGYWFLAMASASSFLDILERHAHQAAWAAGASATSTVSAGAFWRLDRARNGSATAEIPAPSTYDDA